MRIDESTGQINAQALFGDRIVLVGIGISALASLILGLQFVDTPLAVGATLVLTATTPAGAALKTTLTRMDTAATSN